MPDILVADRGATRIFTLNRPEVRNALSRPLRRALASELVRASEDEAVRSIVLTGAGSAFCAGLDLSELEGSLAEPPEVQRADADALASLFASIYRLPKPVVAAVNGPAIAGGTGLASVCDIVIAEPSVRFGFTEVRLGFVPALVAVFALRQLGERAARRLLLGGHLIGAEEAAAIGLVDEVVPDGGALGRALVWGRRFAANAPGSLGRTKGLIASLGGDLDRELEEAAAINAEVRAGDELVEGLRSFFERRVPSWALGDHGETGA